MELSQPYRLLDGSWSRSAAAAPVVPPQAPGDWDLNLPVPVPAPAPVPVPAPVFKPQRGKDLNISGQFKRADANDSLKLSRQEFKAVKGENFDAFDRNDDQKVTWREFLMTRLRRMSFEGLDADQNGKLEGKEMSRIVSYAGTRYDRDGNGAVSKDEFVKAYGSDEKAMLKAKGRDFKAHRQREAKRRNTIMAIADQNRDGVLKGAELKRYKSYDANDNGMISKKEFARAYNEDKQAAARRLRLEGKLPEGMAKRLWLDRLGQKEDLPTYGVKLDARKVAALLGSPVANVEKNLPYVQKALDEAGIKGRNALIGVLATIRTEVGNFAPIHEYGGPGYWAQYNGRSDLGNRPGTNDGVRYHGRGYIQLTGRANYGTYGRAVGVNLVKNPNKALSPKVAAKVLVAYFKARGLDEVAKRGDWLGVRKGVNGGTNGWDTFAWAVNRLKSDSSWYKEGWHK